MIVDVKYGRTHNCKMYMHQATKIYRFRRSSPFHLAKAELDAVHSTSAPLITVVYDSLQLGERGSVA